MRIKKKNVLKESYLINEAILLDQLTHIKPNVKKVLRLINKKFVPKNKENFYWWRLSQLDIQTFLEDEMTIPKLDAYKISRFFIKYGERLFDESEDYIYDLPVKEVFHKMFGDYVRKFSKEKNLYPDIEFKMTINDKGYYFTDPYTVWDSYSGFNIYLGYHFNINTSVIVRAYFDLEDGGGENTTLIKQLDLKMDVDGGDKVFTLIPTNIEIDLPKDETYESFVEWMQDLIKNIQLIISDKKFEANLKK